MVQVIEKAKQRLASLEAEAAKLRDFIAVYEALSTDAAVHNGDTTSAKLNRTDDSRLRRSNAKPGEIIRVAKEAIATHGHPMTRSQLVAALEDRGLVIGGADKNKNMGTILWRSKQFYSVEGEGYWPVDIPQPKSPTSDT